MKTLGIGVVLWALLLAITIALAPPGEAAINVSGAGSAPLKVVYSSLAVDLSAPQTNTVVNANEAGTLIGIVGRVATAPTGFSPTTTLSISIDGQAASIGMWAGAALPWTTAFSLFKSGGTGFGEQDNDQFHLALGHPYSSNLTVQVIVGPSGSGSLVIGVLRGVRF